MIINDIQKKVIFIYIYAELTKVYITRMNGLEMHRVQ